MPIVFKHTLDRDRPCVDVVAYDGNNQMIFKCVDDKHAEDLVGNLQGCGYHRGIDMHNWTNADVFKMKEV